MSLDCRVRPDDPGWIDLRKGKKLWARYHAGRRMLHIVSGNAEAFFSLDKYDANKPKQ